jgi:(p)ppGpp synthase/HD superfamily hydrolase
MQGIDYRDIHSLEQSLDWAIHEASTVHFGQVDKAGFPYIMHPLRVMMRMKTLEEKIIAVLHDVVEDGGVSRDHIRDYTNGIIADAVMALSRNKDESYKDFIVRVKQNDLARRVKIADLHENLDRTRILNPTDIDLKRWEKYERALKVLEEV